MIREGVQDKHPPAASPVDYLTPDEFRRARLNVCGLAHDAEDARMLLEALDLLE